MSTATSPTSQASTGSQEFDSQKRFIKFIPPEQQIVESTYILTKAFYNFVEFIRKNPFPQDPNAELASKACNHLNTLRKAILIHGFPSEFDIAIPDMEVVQHVDLTELDKISDDLPSLTQRFIEVSQSIDPSFSQTYKPLHPPSAQQSAEEYPDDLDDLSDVGDEPSDSLSGFSESENINSNMSGNFPAHVLPKELRQVDRTCLNSALADEDDIKTLRAGLTSSAEQSLRAALWKLLILGPTFVAKYELGTSHIFRTSKSRETGKLPPTFDSASPRLFQDFLSMATRKQISEGLHHDSAPSISSFTDIDYVSAEDYLALCEKGPSVSYQIIRNDSFRTFPSDHIFKQRVPEQSIVRLCSAFEHKYYRAGFKYCQGLNVFAGVFLYIMPELDAFNCFSLYCTRFIPLYWRSNHIGVQAGCILLDQVLAIIDPELKTFLHGHQPPLQSIIFAFPFVKTISATASPLTEAIKLWDMMLALGPHMSVIFVAAQLRSIRKDLLQNPFPEQVLNYRKWPRLHGRSTIALSYEIIHDLYLKVPKLKAKKGKSSGDKLQLFDQLLRYPLYNDVVKDLTGRETYKLPSQSK